MSLPKLRPWSELKPELKEIGETILIGAIIILVIAAVLGVIFGIGYWLGGSIINPYVGTTISPQKWGKITIVGLVLLAVSIRVLRSLYSLLFE